MAKETLTVTLDSKLKAQFLDCVKRLNPGDTNEALIALISTYVERCHGYPAQEKIIEKISETVYEGDQGCGLDGERLETIILQKTKEEIEANRLA